MNVFQLIKSVLDEIYTRLPGDDARKDANIKKQAEVMRDGYKHLATKPISHNYADPVTRFAYIYVYVTSHANVVYQLIRKSSALRTLFKRDQVNITCIGGGPGSDFLGILKYIFKDGTKVPRLKLSLFDKESAWSECWSDVDDKLGLPISNVFQNFDVTDPKTWKPYDKYLSADLFTMIFFMSEIDSLRAQAEPFFAHLFNNAKQGALLLYVDNRTAQFYNWFDSLMSAHGWKVLESGQERLTIEDLSERKEGLDPYYTKFWTSSAPRLTANIAYRVCQKQ
jgi:hypothetical protein